MKSIITLGLLLLFRSALSSPNESPSPLMAVHLLSYIASDYGLAVSKGQILSKPEYEEQKEFVQIVFETIQKIPKLQNSSLASRVEHLKHLVETKASPQTVVWECDALKREIIKVSNIKMLPAHWPDRQRGKSLYETQCASCHGSSGRGDGPASGGLDPKPTDFFDEKMSKISLFQAYSTIQLGVPGTSMASYSSVPEGDLWDLASYVLSVRYENRPHSASFPPVTLEVAATQSEEELLNLHPKMDEQKLAEIRLFSIRDSLVFPLHLARQYLNELRVRFSEKHFSEARMLSIRAYLEGIEPLEARLRANHPESVIQIEEAMAELRAKIEAALQYSELELKVAEKELDDRLTSIHLMLNDLETKLQTQKEMNFFAAFSLTVGIVMREAFEAILIVITLLGVIRTMPLKKANIAIHAGWGTAVLFGFFLWAISGLALQSSMAQWELLEGVLSSFAVFVLLYLGFWLHRRSEIQKWKTYLYERVSRAGGKPLWVLFTIAFVAVFRETFETVIFLRALTLETHSQNNLAIGSGVAFSVLSVVLLSIILLKTSQRLPLQRLFQVSSALLLSVAIVLTGKAVHAFQESGCLSITLFPLRVRADLIGLYPTYESLFPQLGLLLVVIFYWVVSRKSAHRGFAPFDNSRKKNEHL